MECDLLVVGAGVSGAFTAARFRQFNPDATICIVERSENSGGRLQSLPLYDQATPNGPQYQAEFGGMRYFAGVHHLVPAVLQQLGIGTTDLPYVDAQGVAYIRGKHIPLAKLGQELSSVYNVRADETGLSPDLLYNRTINQVLSERNLTVANVLDDSYMVNHTMFNVLRDANMSSEAISAYTDTAGYEWVLGSNAAIVAQEDQAIEGWGRMQTFVKTGFQSLVSTLMALATKSENTSLLLKHAVADLSWDPDGVTVRVVPVKASPVGDPIPRPVYPANSTTIRAKRAVLTVNPLQLFSMAEWPWDVHSLLFDVEQVETVKIFLRFGSEWWNDILPGTGRSVTTLPLRQVWAYAPKVLMVYGDSNNARFWKPYLVPHAKPTPTWIKSSELPDLTKALFAQLSEMFEVGVDVIAASSTDIAFAYWERCTAFWRAGCDIQGNINRSTQPMDGIPVHLASDLWSAQQGWVEGALDRTEAVLGTLGIPSVMQKPLPTPPLEPGVGGNGPGATLWPGLAEPTNEPAGEIEDELVEDIVAAQ